MRFVGIGRQVVELGPGGVDVLEITAPQRRQGAPTEVEKGVVALAVDVALAAAGEQVDPLRTVQAFQPKRRQDGRSHIHQARRRG